MNWNSRWVFTFAVIAWLAFLLEAMSDAGVGFPTGLVVIFGTLLLFLGTVLLTASYRRSVTTASPAERFLHRLFPWLILPAAGVVAGAAVLAIFLSSQSTLNPFFRLRFFLSRAALYQAAIDPAVHKTSSPPVWIGLFKVLRIERYDREVRFITVQCGVIDSCGLAYLRDGPAKDRRKTKLTPVAKSWYLLYEVF